MLELVEGEALADRIARAGSKGLPVKEALDIARQIADALDAAHEKGIVHRDLKPANIKITPQGVVKVLDFGLAKLEATSGDSADGITEAPTITVNDTREGLIVGTAAYMSPEQARGQAVDKRTDIWAFGCVLYEMLTGRAPFARATVTDTLAAIVEREPDRAALPRDLPPAARRLIRRCLAKDSRRRLQHFGDARLDLDEAEMPESVEAIPRSRRAWLRTVTPWAALLGVVVGAGVVYLLRASPSAPAALEGTIERVTSDPGYTARPALSPDGKLLAFASDRSGRGDLDIWVQQTSGGIPLRLTDDPADDDQPSFSADGSQITFRSERNGGGVYIVPALGGAARLVAKEGRNPRFSPDGTRIAYWTGQFRGSPSLGASAVFVISLAGGTPERILGDFAVARQPMWSADGHSILVLGRRNVTAPLMESFDYWWIPLDGHAPVRSGLLDLRSLRASTDAELVDAGGWTDEGVLLVEGATLWSIPVSPSTGHVLGPGRQLSFGTGRFTAPTTSRDGVVAFGVPAIQRVIKRAPLGPDSNAPPAALYTDVRPTTGRASTSDGSTIVFERVSGSRVEIWRKDLMTGDQGPVFSQEIPGRSDAQRQLNATVSPDGRLIGYTVPGRAVEGLTGQGVAYVIDVGGGVPKHVCDECLLFEFLSDGRHAVVTNRDRSIGIVDLENGTSALLIEAQQGARVDRPSVSPDDRWVAFRRIVDTRAKVLIATMTPGQPAKSDRAAEVDEPTVTGRPAGWSPDSRLLYLLLDTDGFRCLWAQPIDPSSGRPVGRPYLARHFHNDNLGTSLGNAATNQGFLYESTTITSNIWRLTRPLPAR